MTAKLPTAAHSRTYLFEIRALINVRPSKVGYSVNATHQTTAVKAHVNEHKIHIHTG